MTLRVNVYKADLLVVNGTKNTIKKERCDWQSGRLGQSGCLLTASAAYGNRSMPFWLSLG